MGQTELSAVIRFCHEAGHLKHSKRTGWWRGGIKDPESVAEHSWRAAVLAYVIAAAEGADPERAATIAVFHDLAETRTGDIEYVAKHYVTASPDEVITKDQVHEMPSATADGILGLVAEVVSAGQSSAEAACAHDADKLECLLQAREYERQGYRDARVWAESMTGAVLTATGRALAAEAIAADPAEWWRDMATSWARHVDE